LRLNNCDDRSAIFNDRNVVDITLRRCERSFADGRRAERTGYRCDARKPDDCVRIQRPAHRVRTMRLYTDDAHVRTNLFDDRGNPGDQPTSADPNQMFRPSISVVN